MVFVANTFETGLADGTLFTTANSDDGTAGNPLSTVTGGAYIYYTSAQKLEGAQSIELDLTTATGSCYVRLNGGLLGTTMSSRFYFRINALPSATVTICRVVNSSAASMGGMRLSNTGIPAFLSAGGAVYATGLTPIVPEAWYRIEVWVTPGTTTSNGRIGWALYEGHTMTVVHSYSSVTANAGTVLAPRGIEAGRSTAAMSLVMQVDDIANTDELVETFIGPSVIVAVTHQVEGTAAVVTDLTPTAVGQRHVISAVDWWS